MTVADIRKMLKNLPPKMKIGILSGDLIFNVCSADSGLEEMEDMVTGEKQFILLLSICSCHMVEKKLEVDVEELNLN